MDGTEERFFAIDLAGLDEVDQGLFESEGALFLGERNFLVQVLQGVAADMVARAVAEDKKFGGGNAASAFFWKQDLGVNRGQGHGQFLSNGILAVGRKRIGDAGDSGGDIHGVKRGENKMAGFGGGYCDAHGFRVAHFANDDDIGRLTKRGAQGGGKIRSVGADFHLFDDAANVLVLVLDGIFDDDDVARFAVIDFVDERGHGGGFAGAGRAAEKHQSALDARELLDGGWKVQIAQIRHFRRQGANCSGGAGAFAMEIDAETAEAFDAVRRIGDAGFAESG